MNIQGLQIVKRAVVGMSVLFLSGFGAYRFIDIGIVRAATTPCIITVFGIQYDVTPLQTSHTGGNIFVCGTDMTATYQAQHGTDVSRLAPYVLATSSPTPTPTAAPSVTPSPTPTGTSGVTSTPAPTPTIGPSGTPGQPHSDDEREEENEDHHADSDEEGNHQVSNPIEQKRELTSHHESESSQNKGDRVADHENED